MRKPPTKKKSPTPQGATSGKKNDLPGVEEFLELQKKKRATSKKGNKSQKKTAHPVGGPAVEDVVIDSKTTIPSSNTDSTVSAAQKYDAPAGLEESTNYVFSKAECSAFDRRAITYGRLLCQQSDRTWDRSYFSTGITAESSKNGHEERCVMLLILLIFCSHDGLSRYDKRMGQERLCGYVHVLTQMLLLEHFLRLDSYPKKDEVALGKYMPLFLSRFKSVVNRTKGNGMKIIKFHLPLHFGGNDEGDLRFGPASSTDSSAGESMHKDFKDAARRTQKNTARFEEQIARNYNDSQVIMRASRELKPANDGAPTSREPTSRGLAYTVSAQGLYIYEANKNKAPRPCITWLNGTLCAQVVDLFTARILPMVAADSLHLKTSATVEGVLYRADPSASPVQNCCFGRHDWVNLKWTDGCVASRIITFFDVTKPEGDNPIECGNGTRILNSGLHAVVQRLVQDMYSVPEGQLDTNFLAHQESCLVYSSSLLSNTNGPKDVPALFVVELNAENVHSPVVSVPFNLDDLSPMVWMIVEPTVEWHSNFQHDMDYFMKQAKDAERAAADKKRVSETETVELPEAKKLKKTVNSYALFYIVCIGPSYSSSIAVSSLDSTIITRSSFSLSRFVLPFTSFFLPPS